MKMILVKSSILLLSLLPISTLAAETPLEHGHKLVETNCAQCHAIGPSGKSPLPIAPPFRDIANDYDQADLIDSFMDGLAVSHKEMPDWNMTEAQAEDITTYIMSLSPPPINAGSQAVTRGEALLQSHCASCHAIAAGHKSPLPVALTFPEIVKTYDPVNISEALAEGIVTGHNQMPEFTFDTAQINDIVAYLKTLKLQQ